MDCATRTAACDRKALGQAARQAAKYVETIKSRRVSPPPESVRAVSELGGPFPDEGAPAADIVDWLDRLASPATMAMGGGRYFGFVNGGVLPAALAADWMASAWGQNVALRVMSPGGAALEDIVLGWVKEILGLPESCAGALVTGATMANVVGLAAARHALLERCGWDVESDGLFGAPPLSVVAGDEVHVSVIKALGIVGLGRRRLERVAVDDQGRMRIDMLPELNDRTIVCLQAGNVNSGAFDAAGEICRRAREAGAWVHVDGAFGLWAAASPRYRHLTEGFENADSWSTDAHKWPNSGYDCGIALVRDPRPLRSAMSIASSYFTPGDLREPAHYGPEMSRRARAIPLWAGLRSLGRRGLDELIQRTCRHAQTFAERFRHLGYEILNDVVINQVLVSFGPAEVTRRVIERVQQDGACWCGVTEWQGRTAMRISVSSWVTTADDVETAIAAIHRIAQETRTEQPSRGDRV
jgi:glutamate/tyrosine decarboxylase-like PLP-dependent enzyme